MKVLLDENVHARWGAFLPGHEVVHVTKTGFAGMKNGELLRLCISHGFDAFVTLDQNLQYQQNLSDLPIKIIIIKAINNRLETLMVFADQTLQALTSAERLIVLEAGGF